MDTADAWAHDAQQRYRDAVSEPQNMELADENGDAMPEPDPPTMNPRETPAVENPEDTPEARLRAAREIDRQAQAQQERETSKSVNGMTPAVDLTPRPTMLNEQVTPGRENEIIAGQSGRPGDARPTQTAETTRHDDRLDMKAGKDTEARKPVFGGKK